MGEERASIIMASSESEMEEEKLSEVVDWLLYHSKKPLGFGYWGT